jgi:hypothetical protein
MLISLRFLFLLLAEATCFWPIFLFAPPHMTALDLAMLVLVLAVDAVVTRLLRRR